MLFALREKLRVSPFVQRIIYAAGWIRYRFAGPLPRFHGQTGSGVAICTRIKDEAGFLKEWLDYYLAAGICHFYIYESFSSDNFREVLAQYIASGTVTLIADWPHVPVTPAAEHDCIRRARGRFAWVGFLDVDEFLVIRNGSSIPEFLATRTGSAIAFHWYFFGTSGHKVRPAGSVLQSYTRRQRKPNRHVKVFLRPEEAMACRNPHCWYFLHGIAVTEAGFPVFGSTVEPVEVRDAWIAHFFTRSEEEYRAKMQKRELCDRSAMKHQRRSEEHLQKQLAEYNEVEDCSAWRYYIENGGHASVSNNS